MNTFNLTLDLAKAKQRQQQTIFVRQGDQNGTTIVATITDHGAAAATSGMTARFQMRLPDGTHYYRKSASLSGNVATVTLDEAQAASAVGRTDTAYFQLLQGSTVVASTESFTVIVLPDALADATVPESYDSAIQDAIDALDDAVEQLPATVEGVLADHPEWTTTVQDGSITKDKLATDLARDRERLLYRLANMLTATLPEGDVATATDAAKTPVAGLALYGRSTQAGTPTPSSPVAIESVAGANLVDTASFAISSGGAYNDWPEGSSNVTAGITWTRNADGSISVKGTATGTSSRYFKLGSEQPAGTTLALSGGKDSSCRMTLCSTDNSNLSVLTDNGSGASGAIGVACDRVRIVVSSGATVDTTIYPMLNAGSTAYPYVPYDHAGLWAKRTSDASTYTVTPIDLDGHELRSLPDGTRDELRVDERGHAVLTQRVGAVTFDGSSDERWDAYAYNHGTGFYISTALFANPSTNKQRLEWVMCDSFETVTSNTTMTAGTFYLGSGTANRSLNFLHGSVTTLDAWRAWLAENPVTVIGLLATPVTHDLGYVAAVPLVGPDLTAQAIPTAPMRLTYERDLNATLARLESAIATLA